MDFLYGEDNFSSGDIFNNLAGAYEQKGELDKAEEYC